MDDWVILAPTRWKLRKAIKATNQVMSELQVIKHPDKTFIGRVARGFDFLGYWFSPAGLGIARKTVERMVENMRRLYEQGASDERIEAYFQRWCRWVNGGISANGHGYVFGFLSSVCHRVLRSGALDYALSAARVVNGYTTRTLPLRPTSKRFDGLAIA
ncbi:MAG: hypothetical protein F6K25_05685 [Okeania sp. SIO2G4]|uniref:hypothetical protein n=1 Tax=unclassified Okeania TaxID=2634635 RepID=UPI0013B64370|nr:MULTISPECIES: hypothetical protein [unclassified Okeania]NEP04894.1 hypothetical protein [Okeania sp. SIO4D6]NEP40307.1 hypothetical protein [Okeania sp. SIO2H7]NEP75065.1 hypothetical protein [Okeania sp. SIO2G5]NEP92202.1 hypothetical protein [Okeania sp. SIO2F5]NEQ90238.1 hypothetical protein [Okeania sp. SIO2G4]